MQQTTPNATTSQPTFVYRERLTVPWWWWLTTLPIIGVLGYEIQLAMRSGPYSWIGYVGVVPICILVLLSMSRTEVAVSAPSAAAPAGEVWAEKAHLPLQLIKRADKIPAQAKRATLGRLLDPMAYVAHKAWVPQMIVLVLDDPDDATPYWLVSTRKPDELLQVIATQRNQYK